MHISKLLDKISQRLLQECDLDDSEENRDFLHFFTHMLARDARIGLNARQISHCKIQSFLENATDLYMIDKDPTMLNIKMTYLFNNSKSLELDKMRKVCEDDFEEKTHKLRQGILQYPETSNKQQLCEMLFKMQVFVIAAYNIGDPKNRALLTQARQSIRSVMSRCDLQNFVRKKKYHRLQYLQRLTATICGIMVYNNSGPQGDKEDMRDVFADIEMAKKNTQESLNAGLNEINEYLTHGLEAIRKMIDLNTKKQIVTIDWPLEKIREINKYVVLFKVYQLMLKKIQKSFEHTEYLVTVEQKKLDCTIEKLNGIVQYRTAVETKFVFPHFKYIAELWTTLQLYLSHFTELSKLKDKLDEIVTEEVKNMFKSLTISIEEEPKRRKIPIEPDFSELQKRTNKIQGAAKSMENIKEHFTEYCALTMGLTNGLLVPSIIDKKLCEDLKLRFGFANMDAAKYAELHFEEFLKIVKNAIYTSVDLILLFELQDEILKQDFDDAARQVEAKTSKETQWENTVENDLAPSNWINVTWNAWDFHRETIHMANLRKKQTHSTQTNISYGKRNATVQSYNRKEANT